MPTINNKRVYYATQQIGLKPDGDTGNFTRVVGAQSVGMTTNFNLEQVFTLGQLEIYQNVENIPDVEVSTNKVLDGYPPVYILASLNALNPALGSRANAKSIFGLSIFDDDNESATGTPGAVVQCSGMYISSVSYSFSTDGAFTEDVTLVGNDKVWANDAKILNPNIVDPSFDGQFDTVVQPTGAGGVNFRQQFIFDYDSGEGLDINGMVADVDTTVLPPEVFGISDSGTNEKTNGADFDAHISSITVSVDFGREDINELGRRGPYSRTATFPVEVTCEVEATATSGDMISATEEGILTTGADPCEDGGNLRDRTIRIATCEGIRIYLGTNNKLSTVNQSGGDAGGGNMTVTYTFSTFSKFTVMHLNDPNTNFNWSGRATYLRDV